MSLLGDQIVVWQTICQVSYMTDYARIFVFIYLVAILSKILITTIMGYLSSIALVEKRIDTLVKDLSILGCPRLLLVIYSKISNEYFDRST